jgi:bacillithiol system protein YtxJ
MVPKAAKFQPVSSCEELARALAAPGAAPVLLFLHDPICPISANAYEEVLAIPYPIILVDVSAGRELSREVEQSTGVRHESPQLLLLRQGEARWSASHYALTTAAAQAVLSEFGGLPGTAE